MKTSRQSRPLCLAHAVLAGVLAAAAPALADDLPDIGDSSGAILSPEQEKRLGESFLRQAHQYGVIVDDPEVDAYFESLGQELTRQVEGYDGTFTFFLVDADSINAFAAPGGYIGAHTGLILNSRSESELASVLAHEISHVTQRHGARGAEAASKMSLPMAAAMLGAILVGMSNPDAAQAAIMAVAAGSQQYQINFTRENEQEADRIGIQLLQRSGFDPHAMATFFERLQTANRYSDPKSYPEYLRTHPVTVNRVSEARERAERLPKTARPDSLEYMLMRTRLRVLTADDPKLLVEEFEQALREGQYEREDVARYGYAEALVAARDFGRARVQVTELLRREPRQIAYLLAAARLDLESGDKVRAVERYNEALRMFPDSRPVVIGYIDALLRTGQGDAARKRLREYAFDHTPDPRYYKMLAQAEELAGSNVESHIALAEYYFSLGETPMAMQQLELARREPDIDYYQTERVLARMDEMKAEMELLEDPNDRRRPRPDRRGYSAAVDRDGR